MGFNRIGAPVDLDLVDFKDSVSIICENCKKVVAKKANKLIKFASQNIVNVGIEEFVCPECGLKSKCVEKK